MVSTFRRAFTLIELLVVIAIITVLVALLMPATSGIWDCAGMTLCMQNLSRIYVVHATYRSQREATMFTYGAGWIAELKPYVEDADQLFHCPGGTLSGSSGGSGAGGIVSSDYSFDIYDGPAFAHLLWNIRLEPASPWIHVQDLGGGVKRYGVEDLGWTGSGDDWCDIVADVAYVNGIAMSITFVQPKNGSQGYRYDLIVNGQVAVHNIDDHKGETVSIAKYAPADYGLNRGAFAGPGTLASQVDGRLFFVLDYVKTEVVYNRDSTQQDIWNKYFILDPKAWTASYGSPDWTWQDFQALRHSGKANVLFCDGHVESLGPEDLDENSSRWRYTP